MTVNLDKLATVMETISSGKSFGEDLDRAFLLLGKFRMGSDEYEDITENILAARNISNKKRGDPSS